MSRREKLLHALHDGELQGRAARRAERELESSPEARAELLRVRTVGEFVREAEALQPTAPDLWEGIARRLPAIDAEREEAVRDAGPSGWLRPLLAGAAVAATALALVVSGVLEPSEGGAGNDVVQWLDTEGAPVMVLEPADDSTVIWVLSPDPDESRGDTFRGLA